MFKAIRISIELEMPNDGRADLRIVPLLHRKQKGFQSGFEIRPVIEMAFPFEPNFWARSTLDELRSNFLIN
jgi:hypothetical protein